ncbi:unnamed protein product [Enterobius vermicularis]|uniref:PLAT domain-containing protein n=1 Tax=Enterobius vermicularis TaxID=51028 RepID=A0A158Q9B2_ENTVE|nr:unnamed protein product [Enterobius vermicularis]
MAFKKKDIGVYSTAVITSELQFQIKLEYKGTYFGQLLSSAKLDQNKFGILEYEKRTENTSREEKTIKWQEKVENPCFAQNDNAGDNSEPCTSSQADRQRLFTYIDNEKPPEDVLTWHTENKEEDSRSDKDSSLAKNNARNSRIAPLSIRVVSRRREMVIDLPSKESMRKARTVNMSAVTMYLMAYLGPLHCDRESYDTNDEYVICKITVINNRIITLEPDVASSSVTLQSRYGNYLATVSIEDANFDLIPSTIDEEVSCKKALNFPHDGLYVEYKVEVPDEISVDGGTKEGSTNISVTKSIDGNDVAVFSHTFSVYMRTRAKSFGENFCFPRILFRICSEDYWGRYYVDGYGFTPLPISPGRHALNITCWRLVNTLSRKAALYDYFVAQNNDVDTLQICGLPNALAQGSKLSRIGLTTTSSGQLVLNVTCILQSQDFISLQLLQQMKYGLAMQRIGLNPNLHWKIIKVLIDFENAKSQLMEIRNKPLPNHVFKKRNAEANTDEMERTNK